MNNLRQIRDLNIPSIVFFELFNFEYLLYFIQSMNKTMGFKKLFLLFMKIRPSLKHVHVTRNFLLRIYPYKVFALILCVNIIVYSSWEVDFKYLWRKVTKIRRCAFICNSIQIFMSTWSLKAFWSIFKSYILPLFYIVYRATCCRCTPFDANCRRVAKAQVRTH